MDAVDSSCKAVLPQLWAGLRHFGIHAPVTMTRRKAWRQHCHCALDFSISVRWEGALSKEHWPGWSVSGPVFLFMCVWIDGGFSVKTLH